MPPKPPTVRRYPSAARARQAAITGAEPENFHKPNLPPLQGTPSARRQYGYGADAEPFPSRPRGRGDVVDLQFAVQDAIEKRDQQMEAARKLQQQRQAGADDYSQGYSYNDEEVNSAAGQRQMNAPSITSQQGSNMNNGSTSPNNQGDDNETDDEHSFSVEDDYFENASIVSSPDLAPQRKSPAHQTQQQIRQPQYSRHGQVRADTPARLRKSPPKQKDGRQQSHRNGHDVSAEIATPARPYYPNLFGKAKNMAPAANPSIDSCNGSDHSEMDDAMQRSIQSDAGDLTRDESRTESRTERLSGTNAQQSIPLLRTNAPEPQRSVPRAGPNAYLWRLLYPSTYFEILRFLLCAVFTIISWVWAILSSKKFRVLRNFFHKFIYYFAAIIGLILVVGFLNRALSGSGNGDSSIDRHYTMPERGVTWPSVTKRMAHKVTQFVPSFSWSRHGSLPDLSHLDNDGVARLSEYLKQYQQQYDFLKQAGKLHDNSLRKLETVVPKLVHMQLEDGKPVVAQEFWHALRDLIQNDDEFFTFEKKSGTYQIASDAHWKAIATRIAQDQALTKQINATVESMEQRVKNGAAVFWDSWVKNNDAKISEMLRSALGQIKSAGSLQDFDERLQRIVTKHINQNSQNSSVVSRDEFLRHLGNEFATYRSEIRAELAELEPKLDKLAHQAAELAQKEMSKSISKEEVVKLVQDMISQAMADVNLEAMARGQIHSHWNSVLRHQVNYFGIGAGAIADAQHMSPDFKPKRDSDYVKKKGLSGIYVSPVYAALEPWTDEGDCWCASHSVDPRGNPHGAIFSVLTGHRIIPQHLVIEHIVAAATTDPGARPKEIEVYAEFSNELREIVRDFSAVHYPDIYPLGDRQEDVAGLEKHRATVPDKFVKISQFVYEDAQARDGVQVHKFSDELLNLGAVTDHVLVRVVSNYGAKGHTCIYRARLFGKQVDDSIS